MPTIVKVTDGVEVSPITASQAGYLGWSPEGATLRVLATQRGRNHTLPNTATDGAKQYYRGGAGQGDPTGATTPA